MRDAGLGEDVVMRGLKYSMNEELLKSEGGNYRLTDAGFAAAEGGLE